MTIDPRPSDLEHADMQGLIARGYPELKAASYIMLQLRDAMSARAFLLRLVDQITPASAKPVDSALNVAITASGLRKLGLPERTLSLFSNPFTAGMITPHRRRALGDVDQSAPERWLWGGPHTPTIDVLLLLFARDAAVLSQTYARLSSPPHSGDVTEVTRLDSLTDLDGKEHFGFADGISQPTIAGLSSRMDTPPNTVQPGEFILGYTNEYGHYTDRPLIEPGADPLRILAVDARGGTKRDLARNGTYLVFRQLSQDVRGFWQWVDQATRATNGASDPTARTWLAAKMVGRWPSGAPLTLAPDVDDPTLATANDFTYHFADRFGYNCPIGSHVRRAHPRDSLDPNPGTVNSVALDKRHRLLRRGREYGPPVDDPLAEAPVDDPDRGLYFICLVANITRQYELVQHTWVNNSTFEALYDESDPLVGNHEAFGATFSVPADPVRMRYTRLPTFVTVRGGAYFFLPGIRALNYLSRLVS